MINDHRQYFLVKNAHRIVQQEEYENWLNEHNIVAFFINISINVMYGKRIQNKMATNN
jgi:hypothetical protein